MKCPEMIPCGGYRLARFARAAIALAMLGCAATPRGRGSSEPATSPAREPELVQPGVVSTEGEENFPAIDPVDGSLWFSTYAGENFVEQTVMRAPRAGSGWGAPARVVYPEADQLRGRAPRFSRDGRVLYLTSLRPAPGATRREPNVWRLDRAGHGWSTPRLMPAPVNSEVSDIHPVETDAGDLYLMSRRAGTLGLGDVFRIPRRGDGWGDAEHLPAPVNDRHNQTDLLVAPDGSWIVLVVTDHPRGLGGDDLFVTRLVDGRWSEPEHLPAPINSPSYEYGPTLSPDGRTLYFNSARRGSADIYRIPLAALGLEGGRR